MYVVVYPELVAALEGNPATAYFVAWLDFRTRLDNSHTYEHEGNRWWRVTGEEMCGEMQISIQKGRTLVSHAQRLGAVLVAEHKTLGWQDRGKSFAVAHQFKTGLVRSAENNESFVKVNSSQPLKSADVPYIEETRKNYSEEFAKFWSAYPRKEGKKNAEKAFAKAIKKIKLDDLLEALEAYKTTKSVKDGFACHAATWLNGERWEDEQAPSPTLAEFDRLVAADDKQAVEALLGERCREPAEIVELDVSVRAERFREYFLQWAAARRHKLSS